MAHYASFTLLTIFLVCGLSSVPATMVVKAGTALGFGQEEVEAICHAHGLERADAPLTAALIGRVVP
jgi:hypothetical protein